MEVIYERTFYKDLSKLSDNNINTRIIALLELLKKSEDISKLPSIKIITGYSDYYRIRIGDYRLGIKYNNHQITLIRFLHRKEIYRTFP